MQNACTTFKQEVHTVLSHADYLNHDALGLADLVRRKEVCAEELLTCAIDRSRQVGPAINAIVLEHQEFAQREIARGLPAGPLCGVPFLLKDLFVDLEGTVTTNGCAALRESVARRTSTAVERYRQAGLVIFGKTHSPEFGASPSTESQIFGASRNPWDLSVTPGGSSGGAAAAIASGIVPAANGSDAGGSIRTPASACGLFGLKPTRGRVPLGPARFDGGGGVAALHAITRSVRDSAALLDATAGSEPGAPYASPPQARSFLEEVSAAPGRLRIALVTTSPMEVPIDPACVDAADAAARLCESLGHVVEPVAALPIDHDLFRRTRVTLRGASAVAGIERIALTLGREPLPHELERATWQFVEQGRLVTGSQVLQAREGMFALHRQIVEFMAGFDVILTPTVGRLPIAPGQISLDRPIEETGAQASRFAAFTVVANLTGQPSMSVPLHWTASGLPVGALFTGRFGDEATLFRLAGQLERAQPWFQRLAPMARQ